MRPGFIGSAAVYRGVPAVEPPEPPPSTIVSWLDCNIEIPTDDDGTVILPIDQTYGPGVISEGGLWPFGATNLSWRAYGGGTYPNVMRFPVGAVSGSAGNLPIGTVVGPAATFGSGAVTVGLPVGQWKLNAINRVGFRIVVAEVTRYGFLTVQVGATILSRTITNIYYESEADNPITVF